MRHPTFQQSSQVVRPSGLFITGTDTGVGKTVVTAALTIALRQRNITVGILKPVETGCIGGDPRSDSARLRAAAGMPDPLELIAPYRFEAPVAPLAAAQLQGHKIELSKIQETYDCLAARYGCMLVEGIGGVRVPITETVEVIDVIRALALPSIVVGRTALGGVNHALLTIEALQRQAIPVLALILTPAGTPPGSDARQSLSTASLLGQLAAVPVLGPLPYVPAADCEWQQTVGLLAQDPAIQRLADLVSARLQMR